MDNKITIWNAIEQMRRITKAGGEFSMAFMSCSLTRQKSEGLIEVPHARLRAQSPAELKENADELLNYTNMDTAMPGQFYQPLLMMFNDKKIEL